MNMVNPFSEKYSTDKTDENLIREAVSGNKNSLESLVRRHQDWIYNIALRMVFNPEEAKDVTQEVLIKIITKLSSFQGRSTFRTWAYRIVVNHVLNMKKSIGEDRHASTFPEYWKRIDETPDYDMPDPDGLPIDTSLLLDEVKTVCMFGMLLCLDRGQRLIYILGGIFGVTDKVGSEIMQISKANFRQKLSRARKDLFNFMNNKCGLIKKDNPCHCDKKTKAMINSGYVNPANLRFYNNYYYKMEQASGEKLKVLNNYFDNQCQVLFREHPFQKSPDFVETLRDMIESEKFKEIFNFH
jgi:RNA polymerase sigma factor (sigma-70 family)